MFCGELFTEIERLRTEMNRLAKAGAGYAQVLEVSQRLDMLIVEYMRTAA
ncbi:MAG: Spo0E like sporulation regulatory protein [Pelotomaculum sp. PtaB.Bin104]|nr:MAG: Spo0E like sporulation regulatory protein [Pelotomaculum sp. PtaB.Bin104]